MEHIKVGGVKYGVCLELYHCYELANEGFDGAVMGDPSLGCLFLFWILDLMTLWRKFFEYLLRGMVFGYALGLILIVIILVPCLGCLLQHCEECCMAISSLICDQGSFPRKDQVILLECRGVGMISMLSCCRRRVWDTLASAGWEGWLEGVHSQMASAVTMTGVSTPARGMALSVHDTGSEVSVKMHLSLGLAV